MITVLHGEDIIRSRQALLELKKGVTGAEIIVLDKNNATLTRLIESLEAKSLFGQEKLVILDNIFALKSKKELNDILKYFEENEIKADVIVWSDKTLTKTRLKYFRNAKAQLFKLPAPIFAFLDSIRPSNTKQMLMLLQNSLKSSEAEFVFYMIIRQLRMLILSKTVNNETKSLPSDFKRLAPWQKGKLKQQAKKFSQERLFELYHQLLDIDAKLKTGRLNLELAGTLDLFVCQI